MIETLILKCLSSNESYTRAVSPFLKQEYFADKSEQALFLIASKYFRKYNTVAPIEVLKLEIDKLRDVSEPIHKHALEIISQLEATNITSSQEWLVENTEAFVKDRALHLAIQKVIEIYQGSEKNLSTTAIPGIMTDALAVSFDHRLGHDFEKDSEAQLDYYHSDVVRIPFDVDILNQITNGGVPRKTLSILVAGCIDENTPVRIRISK